MQELLHSLFDDVGAQIPSVVPLRQIPVACFPEVELAKGVDQRGETYAMGMVNAIKIPPIVVDADQWLDGRHRVWASRYETKPWIWAIDLKGLLPAPPAGVKRFPLIGRIKPISALSEQELSILYAHPYGDAAPESMKPGFDAASSHLQWKICTIDRQGFAALGFASGEKLHGLDPSLSDLNQPIVFSVGDITEGENPWMIWDGVHRVFSAYALGETSLPAVVGLQPGMSMPAWLKLCDDPSVMSRVHSTVCLASGEPAKTGLTDRLEFETWFSESKAVDSTGRPLVVYHGTNKEFSVFKAVAGPRSQMVGDWEGIHFTNDRAQAQGIAESLARSEGGTARVVEAYLQAKNPVPFGTYRTKEQAIAAGHDSRLTENNVGLQEWTVFDSSQVKFATEHIKELGAQSTTTDTTPSIAPIVYTAQRSFANALKPVKEAIYSELIEATDAGPFDGGCVVFADSLQSVIGGTVVVITNKSGRGDHAAVELGGKLYDFDGPLAPKQFIARFERNEHAEISGYRPMEDHDLPDAPRGINGRLVSLLKQAFGMQEVSMQVAGQYPDDVAGLQKQLAAVEAKYETLRLRKLQRTPEWDAISKEAAPIHQKLFDMTGDWYGKPKVKMVKPSDEALEAEYASPDEVPADVRLWVQKNTSLLYSDATDAVRWGRIADTLHDERFPADDLIIYRAVGQSDYDEIRPGDWVTTDLAYAEQHLSKSLDGKGQILEETVDGRDVLVSPTGNYEEAIYAPRELSGPVITRAASPQATPAAPVLPKGVLSLDGNENAAGFRLGRLKMSAQPEKIATKIIEDYPEVTFADLYGHSNSLFESGETKSTEKMDLVVANLDSRSITARAQYEAIRDQDDRVDELVDMQNVLVDGMTESSVDYWPRMVKAQENALASRVSAPKPESLNGKDDLSKGFVAIGKQHGIFFERDLARRVSGSTGVGLYDLIDNEDVVKSGIVGDYNALVELGAYLRSKGLIAAIEEPAIQLDINKQVKSLTKAITGPQEVTQQRAKAGGEVGPNGEWYKGGAFIATTDLPKATRQWIARNTSTTQVQVDFYEAGAAAKADPRVGEFPILRMIGGNVLRGPTGPINELHLGYLLRDGSPESIQYVDGLRDLVSKFVAGERWAKINDYPEFANIEDLVRMIVAGEAIPGAALDKFPEKIRANFSKAASITAPNKPQDAPDICFSEAVVAERFVVNDSEVLEVNSRIDRLPNLLNSAGTAYTFWKLAMAAISKAGGEPMDVDWHAVEDATIQEAIGKNKQTPQSVHQAISQVSPGALSVTRQAAVLATAQAVYAQQQARSKTDVGVSHGLGTT